MKKILIILIPIIILGGAGAWYVSQSNKEITPGNTETSPKSADTAQEDKEESKSITGKLSEIVNLGTAVKCTWNHEETNTSGTAWIKDKKTYTEVTTPEGEFNAITKDNCVWSWGETLGQGVKVCYEDEEDIFTPDSEDVEDMMENRELVEPPTDVDYKCKKTPIADSKFNPPENIEFISLDELMKGFEDLQKNAEDLIPEGFEM